MKLEQAEINRANSQHSTGPKTEAGKQRSSLNALRHGLTSQLVVMPGEDLRAYESHLKSFNDEYRPQGATEQHLVQALADVSWRLNRVATLEAKVLTLAEPLESQLKALANPSLHSQRLSRQFERTVAQLRELQKPRQSQEEAELDDLLDIIEMFDEKEEPYNPSDDGFVFSQTEIDAAMQARTRKNLAEEAYDYQLSAAA